MKQIKWKHKKAYMEIAKIMANVSSGMRLKVGAVIVKDNNIISTGYNALPEHIDGALESKVYALRHEDLSLFPYKDECGSYRLETKPEVRHAEKNALMALTKRYESSTDSVLFVTHSPCKYCAIDIVDAGIKTVYYLTDYRDPSGIDYLKKNGVWVEKMGDKDGI